MMSDNPPQEAASGAEARQWIGANAPKEFEAELCKSSLGRIRLQKAEIVDVGRAWQKKKADAGFDCLHWAMGYSGPRRRPAREAAWQKQPSDCGQEARPLPSRG